MRKNNIRSIRFSDELAELIDRQVGDTFTAKFESLVTRCVWELPEKERQLEQLEEKIAAKREELMQLNRKAIRLGYALGRAESLTADIQSEILQALKKEE